jgi:ribosomal protein L37E
MGIDRNLYVGPFLVVPVITLDEPKIIRGCKICGKSAQDKRSRYCDVCGESISEIQDGFSKVRAVSSWDYTDKINERLSKAEIQLLDKELYLPNIVAESQPRKFYQNLRETFIWQNEIDIEREKEWFYTFYEPEILIARGMFGSYKIGWAVLAWCS